MGLPQKDTLIGIVGGSSGAVPGRELWLQHAREQPLKQGAPGRLARGHPHSVWELEAMARAQAVPPFLQLWSHGVLTAHGHPPQQ